MSRIPQLFDVMGWPVGYDSEHVVISIKTKEEEQ
jgi:hypothetical protein